MVAQAGALGERGPARLQARPGPLLLGQLGLLLGPLLLGDRLTSASRPARRSANRCPHESSSACTAQTSAAGAGWTRIQAICARQSAQRQE